MEKKKVNKREFLLSTISALGAAIVKKDAFAGEKTKIKIPKQGEKVYKNEGNFAIFPERISFLPANNKRRLIIVSTTWQTAAFYDNNGNKMSTADGKVLNFLIGSGSNEKPTNLGLHEVLERLGKDHKSNTYPKPNGGAPMPNAIALGEVSNMLDDGEIFSRKYDGTALHYSDTVTEDKKGEYSIAKMSNGCIRLGRNISDFFYENIISRKEDTKTSDLVLIVEDKIPQFPTLKEIFAYFYFINMKKKGITPYILKSR